MRNSRRWREAGRLRFLNWPRTGFVNRLSLLVPKPSCSAVYPSRSLVRISVTVHGPASITVTGTMSPFSSKTCVMPTFLPIKPIMSLRSFHGGAHRAARDAVAPSGSPGSGLDLDVDTRGDVELLE